MFLFFSLRIPSPSLFSLWYSSQCCILPMPHFANRDASAQALFRTPILKILFIFDQRITALQYCIGFCHTSTWISHRYNMSPPSEPPSHSTPPPPHPTPLGYHTVPVELPVSNNKFPLAVCFPFGNVCFHAALSIHPTLHFSHCVHKSVLYLCLHCCPAKRQNTHF